MSMRGMAGHGKRRIDDLLTNGRRAARAFRTNEFAYRLALLTVGDLCVAYRTGTADEQVVGHSFQDDIFLPELPEYEPGANDVVIDVGAHIGTFTMLVAPRVRRVYAVEASRETFDYLRVNCLMNDLDNVKAFHLALGGSTGTTVLHHARANWEHSIMTTRARSPDSEVVRVSTLRDFMSGQGIDRCSLLRMNCEGAEFPILLNAPLDVLRTIDFLLILYHCDLAPGYKPEQLDAHLRSAGFEVQIRNRTSDRGWIIASCRPAEARMRPTANSTNASERLDVEAGPN